MPKPEGPTQNHLLGGVGRATERARLFPQLELVPMPLGKVLYESGSELDHVYFPTNCIVSLLYVMTDGSSAEIAVVGNEGLVGVALFMGGETTPSRAVVQSAGFAYRLDGKKDEGGVQPRRRNAAFVASIHAGVVNADGTDGRV